MKHSAPASFCRPVLATANSLSQLAAAAAAAYAQLSIVPIWLSRQLQDGCLALIRCAVLSAYAPQLSAQTAYRLGAACSLVFGPGRTALERIAAAVQALPSPDFTLALASMCRGQVKALAATMNGVLRSEVQPQAAAAFASSVAKPAVLLPLLVALSQAVPLVVTRTGQGE